MKKTMITLAAVFAATVSMAAVTSQIVGYQNIPCNDGFTTVTPTFLAVDGTFALKFKDLKGNFTDWNMIQFLDSIGDGGMLAYYNEAEGKWLNADGSDDDLSDIDIPTGTGFLLYQEVGSPLVISGAVDLSNSVIALNPGFTCTGIFRPVATKYKDLAVTGVHDWSMIQFLDSIGDGGMLAYYNEAEGKWLNADGSDTDLSEEVIPAGQAFLLYCETEGATLGLPQITL